MELEKAEKSISIFETETARCGFRHQFWRELNLSVEWKEIEGDPLAPREAGVILVDPADSTDWLHRIKRFPQDIQRIEFVDSVWLEAGTYWPRAFYARTLTTLMTRFAKTLDTKAWAYVAGVGPWARLAVLLAFDLGFSRVRLVCHDPSAVQELIDKVGSFCFGIELEPLQTADLTLQPNNGSLLINCYDLLNDADMKQTLLYLNFIREPGLLVDLPFNFQAAPLIDEGKVVGYPTISSVQVRGLYDYYLLHRLGVDTGLPWPEYLNRWQDFLSELR